MKISVFFLVIGFMIPVFIFSQKSVNNSAFKAGEKLTYKLSYNSTIGEVYAGTAIIEVKKDTSGPVVFYQFVGTGETNNFFDFFYEVNDKFVSAVDSNTLLPYRFIRNTREGKYSFDDTVVFNRDQKIATSLRETKPVPSDVFDIVSAVYFMRTLKVVDFGADSTYSLNFFLDDSVYNTRIKYEGREILNTKWGPLPCLKVKPMMATGEVFSRKYPMTVWITDDENHIPVLGDSEIIVGSVRMELSGFEGLKNPFIKPLSRKEVKNFK